MASLTNSFEGQLDNVRCQLCHGRDNRNETVKVCKICHVFLCSECADLHRMGSSSRHEIVTLRFYLYEIKDIHCRVHDDLKCQRFCEDCDYALCVRCLDSGQHQNHSVHRSNSSQARAQDVVQCKICSERIRTPGGGRFCKTCRVNFCQDCLERHKTQSSAEHDIITFGRKYFENGKLHCMLHQNLKCDTFCIDCDVALCEICLDSGFHNNHDTVESLENKYVLLFIPLGVLVLTPWALMDTQIFQEDWYPRPSNRYLQIAESLRSNGSSGLIRNTQTLQQAWDPVNSFQYAPYIWHSMCLRFADSQKSIIQTPFLSTGFDDFQKSIIQTPLLSTDWKMQSWSTVKNTQRIQSDWIPRFPVQMMEPIFPPNFPRFLKKAFAVFGISIQCLILSCMLCATIAVVLEKLQTFVQRLRRQLRR